jgi:hypothetical protein
MDDRKEGRKARRPSKANVRLGIQNSKCLWRSLNYDPIASKHLTFFYIAQFAANHPPESQHRQTHNCLSI